MSKVMETIDVEQITSSSILAARQERPATRSKMKTTTTSVNTEQQKLHKVLHKPITRLQIRRKSMTATKTAVTMTRKSMPATMPNMRLVPIKKLQQPVTPQPREQIAVTEQQQQEQQPQQPNEKVQDTPKSPIITNETPKSSKITNEAVTITKEVEEQDIKPTKEALEQQMEQALRQRRSLGAMPKISEPEVITAVTVATNAKETTTPQADLVVAKSKFTLPVTLNTNAANTNTVTSTHISGTQTTPSATQAPILKTISAAGNLVRKQDRAVQVSNENYLYDEEFLNVIRPQMREMNARQKMHFKKKVFVALMEVFDDATDFPHTSEQEQHFNINTPSDFANTSNEELKLIRELVAVVQASKTTAELQKETPTQTTTNMEQSTATKPQEGPFVMSNNPKPRLVQVNKDGTYTYSVDTTYVYRNATTGTAETTVPIGAIVTKATTGATTPPITVVHAATANVAETVTKAPQIVTKPVQIVTKPAQIVTKPAQIVTKPAQIVTKPAQIVTKPAQIVTKPAQIVTKPAQIVTKPAQATKTILVTSNSEHLIPPRPTNVRPARPGVTVQRIPTALVASATAAQRPVQSASTTRSNVTGTGGGATAAASNTGTNAAAATRKRRLSNTVQPLPPNVLQSVADFIKGNNATKENTVNTNDSSVISLADSLLRDCVAGGSASINNNGVQISLKRKNIAGTSSNTAAAVKQRVSVSNGITMANNKPTEAITITSMYGNNVVTKPVNLNMNQAQTCDDDDSEPILIVN